MAQRLTPAQIAALARARGLDPNAVGAVGGQEGYSGRIGDSGHAFGPFQLNDAGGVLTGKFPGWSQQQKQEWAWSQPGVEYALGGIQKVAGGQRGPQAVRSIVSRFERPKDIVGETARALAGLGGTGSGSLPSPTPVAAAQPSQFNPGQLLQLLGGVQGGDYSGFYHALGKTRANQARPPVPDRIAGQLGADPQASTIPVGATGIAKTALTQLGTPYQWGGPAKLGSRTDCSGLLQASARANGINLGRTTYEQFKQGSPVALNQLQPGDAVFFHPGPKGPEHVTIYIGGGKVVEDPHTGAAVSISELHGRKGVVGARRYG